jgi:hypothetical protein
VILPIFPEGGLSSSVITTVWVGVFILAFFNLRFGWVMSGLVVPGYVVPLLILRPIAAGVIVVEAILTYAIVWLFSERIARGRFNGLFGRDRFMGLVLASIAVRVTLDGWLLPDLAGWMSSHFDRQIDWHSNLQSFGLVVISLMANQFWKPGLMRGLFAMFVVTGLTWLIVRYGLMEFTNFRLSGVSYVYEGLASSILASPKAYIILVITAFIGSQMNLRYGWDFSGVLIPALIALQWYQPAKILSSFVEAGIIYFLAHLVMKLPIFANTTIEGARKLVLFFNVSFVYKLVLGHIIAWLALDVKTTDFYGFGYLLSTLLAIKAYDKNIFPRVIRSTLEVSLAGAVLGNIVGFLLAFWLPAQGAAGARTGPDAALASGNGELLVAAAAGDAHIRAATGNAPKLDLTDALEFQAAIELLESGAEPELVAPGLAGTGFQLTHQSDGTIAIARRKGSGRDLLLFDPRARRRLAVLVPDAAAEPGLAAAGLALFRVQGARWLIIAAPSTSAPTADGVLIAGPGLIQSFRIATLVPELVVKAAEGGQVRRMVLTAGGATALDLEGLRRSLPQLASSFELDAATEGAKYRDRVTLQLDRKALALLSTDGSDAAGGLLPCPAIATSAPSRAGTAAMRPADAVAEPDLAQLAFIRFELAEPLVDALAARQPIPLVARRAAALAGLSLDRCLLGGREQWRLGTPGNSWGSVFLTPGANRSRIIEVSAPETDVVAVAETIQPSWDAGAMLVAPRMEALYGSQASVFGVVSQVLLRSLGAEPGALLQIRRKPAELPLPSGDAAIAVVPDMVGSGDSWAASIQRLAAQAGLRPILVDYGRATAGLEVAPNQSLRYFAQTLNKRYATLWVLPGSKKDFSGSDPAKSEPTGD